ncbi:MAG: ATP-binding cassette domain-containing protein, partial [Deltaproteobacteria bacterium]
MALITLRNVGVAFGGPMLLDGINLQLEEGDRLCLMGRNGTGKSTLMKLISGEISPDEGDISRRQGLRVALVSQEIPQGLSGSVFDIVAGGMGNAAELLAEYHHLGHRLAAEGGVELLKRLESLQKALEDAGGWRLHREVERILTRLQLLPDEEFASLSGGTKRRALLARALVSEPDIL